MSHACGETARDYAESRGRGSEFRLQPVPPFDGRWTHGQPNRLAFSVDGSGAVTLKWRSTPPMSRHPSAEGIGSQFEPALARLHPTCRLSVARCRPRSAATPTSSSPARTYERGGRLMRSISLRSVLGREDASTAMICPEQTRNRAERDRSREAGPEGCERRRASIPTRSPADALVRCSAVPGHQPKMKSGKSRRDR